MPDFILGNLHAMFIVAAVAAIGAAVAFALEEEWGGGFTWWRLVVLPAAVLVALYLARSGALMYAFVYFTAFLALLFLLALA